MNTTTNYQTTSMKILMLHYNVLFFVKSNLTVVMFFKRYQMTHLTSKCHTYQHALDSLRHLAQMLPPQSFQYHCKIYKTQNPEHSLAHFLLLLVNTMLKICLLFIFFTKQDFYSPSLLPHFLCLCKCLAHSTDVSAHMHWEFGHTHVVHHTTEWSNCLCPDLKVESNHWLYSLTNNTNGIVFYVTVRLV